MIFFNMKVCCVFSLESPHGGDSNEYTQYTIFNIKKEKSPIIILSLPLWDFSKGLKNEFETAVVDEPSVFQPLKFYCSVFAVRGKKGFVSFCKMTKLLSVFQFGVSSDE